VIEKAVLAFLADGDLIGPLLAGQSQGNRLAELEGRVEAAQKRAAKLLAVIEGDSEPSKLVYASLKASEAEAGQAQQALEAERERVRTERPAAQAYDQFMAALPALAKDPGQRGALRQAVASVVEKLVIDPRGERRGNVKRWEFAVQLRGAKDAVPILALKDGAAFPSLSPYPRIAGNLV
jgi:hypothetical protein